MSKKFEDLSIEEKNNLLTELQKLHGLMSFDESDLKEYYQEKIGVIENEKIRSN